MAPGTLCHIVRYATHVKDLAPVLSNAASDVLEHFDLISYPPDIDVGALSIRLR
jgi:hypothetical protein